MAKMKGFGGLGKIFGVEPPPEKKSQPQKNFQSSQKNSSAQRNSPQQNFSEVATAPYNFVSLPEKVLPAQFDLENFREHFAAGNISGEILLDIETLTPLFIGGQGSKSFAPVDTPIIPGSTLRGMFKNIFKIVTCGAFRGQEDFNDEHIYFRSLMRIKALPWTESLHKLYAGRMVRNDDKKIVVKNARPGFLIRKPDGKYFIAPSIYTSDRKEDFITIKDFQEQFDEVKFRDSRIHWGGKIAYIVTGNQWAKKPERLLDAAAYKQFKEYLKALRKKKDAGKISESYYAAEARKHGKQIIRFTSLDYIEPNRDKWLEVPDEVQSSYRHDRNRGGVDLFKNKFLTREQLERRTGQDFPDVDTIIPCHFLTDGDTVTAFGHGQCFRIPYENSIGDAVKISGNDAIDFADAVFGKEKFWASRVYFEDAAPEKFSELPTATAHPLMQPNPTSYQLYLEQDGAELKHWDAKGAQLRGYKLYWHNAAPDWHATNSERALDRDKSDDKRLTKEMTPLAEGIKFAAKIRFKNLTAVELGALMMIFDLDGLKDAAYKIGQGKPFGFGSVRITPKLFIESDDAYTELFDGDGWKNPCREENPAGYLDEFKKYLTAHKLLTTWQKIMDDLTKILDWSQTKSKGWSAKVKSMSGDVSQKDNVDERFIKRAPLPTIFEVVK